MNKKLIFIGIIIFIVGFAVGMVVGIDIAISRVADIASRFVEIDEGLISQAIFQYKNNIGGCYAPLHNYTGN